MASDPGVTELTQLNRTMKDISFSIRQMTRVLEAVNINLVELAKRFPPKEEEK